MTPFLLRRLGSETLGFWLVAQQLLGYLLLMDLGVTAVLPRETAYAVGRAGGARTGNLASVIARARRATSFQVPLVCLATVAVGIWAAHANPASRCATDAGAGLFRAALPVTALSVGAAGAAGTAVPRQVADRIVAGHDRTDGRAGPGGRAAVGAGRRMGRRPDTDCRGDVAPRSSAPSTRLAGVGRPNRAGRKCAPTCRTPHGSASPRWRRCCSAARTC